MGVHSIIPASSAHRWGSPDGCTGWVTMSQLYPDTGENPEAADGEASHEIGSRLIINQTVGNISNYAENFVDNVATNGIIFTEEMYDAAKIYSDDVGEIMRSTGVFGGDNFGNEQRIEAPDIHELSFGTTDQFIFNRKTGDLYLWDYKFGYEVVEAFENWQLLVYFAGIIRMLGLNCLDTQHITVHFRIIQPRAHHHDGIIREWKVKASDLRAQVNTLHTNAAISLGGNATTRSGPHCKHCSARHVCESALQAGIRMFEIVSKPTPLELSSEAAGVQLSIIKRAIKQLELLESGFDEQVKNLILKGVNVQGWQVEQGLGREKWSKPTNEVIAMGEMLGHDLKKPDEVITPVQARNKGVDNAMIAMYSETPKKGLKLTPDNGNKAKLIFGDK